MGEQAGGDDKIEIHLAWIRKRVAGINNSRPFFLPAAYSKIQWTLRFFHRPHRHAVGVDHSGFLETGCVFWKILIGNDNQTILLLTQLNVQLYSSFNLQ